MKQNNDGIYLLVRKLICFIALSTCIVTAAFPGTIEHPENPQPPRTFSSLLAVKSNLLYWTGIMPDFKYYRWTPNLGLECFFADRWSVNATGAYAKRKVGGDKYYGVSTWSLEPRIWLRGDGTYQWLFAGIYGEAGDFDNQRIHIDDCRTGAFFGIGFSVGLHIPVNNRIGAEVGIRAGYNRRSVDYYTAEDGHYYFDYNKKKNKYGITGINVSIVYRLGK